MEEVDISSLHQLSNAPLRSCFKCGALWGPTAQTAAVEWNMLIIQQTILEQLNSISVGVREASDVLRRLRTTCYDNFLRATTCIGITLSELDQRTSAD